MPNREWRGNIIGTSNFFLNELAAALPSLISLLLRLAALYLFFCYLFAFCCGFSADSLPLTLLSGIAALLAAVLLIWKVINPRTKFDLDKEIQPACLRPLV